MEETYIPPRDVKAGYERAHARLEQDRELDPRDRELLLRYLRDARLGKTVIGKSKKRIGPSRLHAYISHLTILAKHTPKPLDKLTQTDVETFIDALDSDKIRSTRTWFIHKTKYARDGPFSPRYKVDIKINIKKFYKWLLGENKTYPPLVDWIETVHPHNEIPALTPDDVKNMLDVCNSIQQRAIIQTLFDGGFRIGELLNVRLRHLTRHTITANQQQQACFAARVPFSKTLRRTVILPLPATTRLLTLWLAKHPGEPRVHEDGHIMARHPEAQLFPFDVEAIRSMLRRAGRRALDKRVYPHLLRHTSATYWSNKLPYFKFCKRFGWTMTSQMPQRYIDRAGVDELEIANIYYQRKADETTLRHPGSSTAPPASSATEPSTSQSLQEVNRLLLDEVARLKECLSKRQPNPME